MFNRGKDKYDTSGQRESITAAKKSSNSREKMEREKLLTKKFNRYRLVMFGN
jgi:hypothetical protein